MMSDKASLQLPEFKEMHPVTEPERLTLGNGVPVGDKSNSLTVGPRGPQLLQDTVYLHNMAHFDRERTVERVVHAKGGGAYGYFECTHDITEYTKAAPFKEIGKQTPLVVRFSRAGGDRGSRDSARDIQGFAIKFYTEEGNWDLVGNNTPLFFIRDAIDFPSFVHILKRNPQTNLRDPNMFWDFVSLKPESTHQLLYHFSDRGIPASYRHMDGFGANTFKLVNSKGNAVYCKFHWKTNQGIKNLDDKTADKVAGMDPDYNLRDLYNSIMNKQYPSWTMYIQVMTFEEAENFQFNPFDVTKVWPHGDFPMKPVGRLVLNKLPINYFAEIEQSAFSVANMIPGVEPSPDKVLQGRLFSYPDTQFYRLGGNHLQIPVNCPFATRVRNYQRDGLMCMDNQGNGPNYFPNSFGGPDHNKKFLEHPFSVSGDVSRYNAQDEDNFTQPGIFFRKVLDEPAKHRLADNIGRSLKKAAKFIQDRALKNFEAVDPDLRVRIENVLSNESLSSSSFDFQLNLLKKDEE